MEEPPNESSSHAHVPDGAHEAAGHAINAGIPLSAVPHVHNEAGNAEGNSRSTIRRDCGCSKKYGRRLVVCIDGTSNQFGDKNTNVIELYRLIHKKEDDNQLTYYNSGIGTYAQPSSKTLAYYKRLFGHKADLAIAWNFERIIIGAYHWLSENYRDGDCIFLFGFSRGAYQVRTLSAMIHKVGLIHRGNEAQIPFAYQLYADPRSGSVATSRSRKDPEAWTPAKEKVKLSPAGTFKDTFSRDIKVHFIGAWDTVSSIGVVRARKLLPHTIDGMTHVCFFRHALALDERRVKFLPEYANGGAGPRTAQVKSELERPPHTKEVWFAGTHSDVGGGNEDNAQLDRTRPSLRWMFAEASAAGLRFKHFERDFEDVDDIKVGKESLTLAWRLFEHLPFRRLTYNEGTSHRHWTDHRWLLFELIAWLLWKLTELLLFLLWLLWKLVVVDWRALRSVWRKSHDGETIASNSSLTTEEGWWRKDTMSWPPHRGKGRIIQDGQKIHTSVWRSKNLGTSGSQSIHHALFYALRSCFRHSPQVKYTPSARLPSEEDFWSKLGQSHAAQSMDEKVWGRWKEVDLYDSVEDLIERYLSHPEVVHDDDTQQVELTMINIHTNSGKGRDALLVELGKHMRTRKIPNSVLCNVMVAMLASSNDRCSGGLGTRSIVQPWMLDYVKDGNKDELQIVHQFLAHLVDTTQVLTGHEYVVTSVAFSPDGKHIASGSWDCTIRIWDAETGLAAGEPFKGHNEPVLSVAFSPNGKHVVSGSEDNTIRIWNVETGQPVGKPFEGHSNLVWSVAYSPDGKRIVSGSFDSSIRIWVAKTGQTVGEPLTGHTGSVYSVAFSPDGTRIISGSYDGTVRIWDVETGQTVGHPLKGHTNSVFSVAFSPDGKRIVSGSWDGTIRIWDARTGERVGEPVKGHSGPVNSVAFSSNGKHIVSGSDDGTVRIWDVKTGQMVGKPYEGHISFVFSVAFSPDGKRVVSGSVDSTIRIWDVLEPLEMLVPETEVQENTEAGPSNAASSPANPSTIP